MQDMITEIKHWKKTSQDWQQTAEMLAMDLGDVQIAFELYADIKDGLYDKVRERLKDNLAQEYEQIYQV